MTTGAETVADSGVIGASNVVRAPRRAPTVIAFGTDADFEIFEPQLGRFELRKTHLLGSTFTPDPIAAQHQALRKGGGRVLVARLRLDGAEQVAFEEFMGALKGGARLRLLKRRIKPSGCAVVLREGRPVEYVVHDAGRIEELHVWSDVGAMADGPGGRMQELPEPSADAALAPPLKTES